MMPWSCAAFQQLSMHWRPCLPACLPFPVLDSPATTPALAHLFRPLLSCCRLEADWLWVTAVPATVLLLQQAAPGPGQLGISGRGAGAACDFGTRTLLVLILIPAVLGHGATHSPLLDEVPGAAGGSDVMETALRLMLVSALCCACFAVHAALHSTCVCGPCAGLAHALPLSASCTVRCTAAPRCE